MENSLYECVFNSFESIFSKVKGFKALVLDSETTSILSLVCTQTYLLENEVFLTLRLDDPSVFQQISTKSIIDIDHYENKSDYVQEIRLDKQRNLKHITALFLVRPTSLNIELLATELSQSIFGSYYFVFTNTISEDRIEKLAKHDLCSLVKGIYEYYTDFYTFSHNIFSLELDNIYSLYKPLINREFITLNSVELNQIFLTYYENETVIRIVDGLFAICCTMSKKPTIIYRKCSPLCQAIASQLQARLNDNNKNIPTDKDMNRAKSCRRGTCLLLYDRRDDCSTPMLTQWTYQAMIHEFIGIKNNKVKLDQDNGTEEFVLSPITDSFFNRNKYLDFADIETATNELVNEYKKKQNNITKGDVFGTLQLVPEQAKLSADVKRHVSIQHVLSKLSSKGDILNQSILEQDICCNNNKSDTFSELYNRIQSPDISPFNRLRLCCLFAVCYSDDKSLINYLKSEMKKMSCSAEDFMILDNLVKYSKSALCKNADRSFFSLAKSAIEHTIKDIPAYMRYNSRLSETLELLLNGKLDGFDYAITPPAFGYQYSLNEMPNSVIVFIVGGATYQESRECDMLSQKTGVRISLGGTSFLNCTSFLSEMAK